MKILVISSCYPRPNASNHGIFVHQQMKALVQMGVEVHVIQPVLWYPPLGLHKLHPYWRNGFDQHSNTFDEFEGVTIHHPRIFVKMPSRWFPEHSWDREARQVADYVARRAKLREADLIYAQFLIHEGYTGTIVKKMTRIPLVSIALGDDVHAWPQQFPKRVPFLKKVLNESDLLLANSKQLARDTEKWGSKDISVKCIYQGIDLKKFAPVKGNGYKASNIKYFNLDTEKKHLLCVATPVVLKGWIELLDAFSSLKSDLAGWKLVIVAPPRQSPDALDLKMEASKRGIQDQVNYLGQVDHENMPRLMQAVDAFVLPSYNEGMSNSVLEALASGLPVIATCVGGHEEVIEHGINGHLIQPRRVDDVQAALNSVLLNSDYADRLRDNARKAAQKVGTYKENAAKLIETFSRFG